MRPLEAEWCKSAAAGGPVVERVKRLRTAVLADLLEKELTPAERDRLWQHLADCYLAQQLDCYPGDYLAPEATVDRILETVERFEEDLTDRARVHRPFTAVVQVGEAIAVDPGRGRSADESLMARTEGQLRGMLDELRRESRPFVG